MFDLCEPTHLLTSCRIHSSGLSRTVVYVHYSMLPRVISLLFLLFLFRLQRITYKRFQVSFEIYRTARHLFSDSLANVMMQVRNRSFLNYTFLLIGLYVQCNLEDDCNLRRKTIIDLSTDHVLILLVQYFFSHFSFSSVLIHQRCSFKDMSVD